MCHADAHGPGQSVIPPEFAGRIAHNAFYCITQMWIDHSLEQILRVSSVAVFGKEIVETLVSLTEGGTRLVDERIAGKAKQIWLLRGIGDSYNFV